MGHLTAGLNWQHSGQFDQNVSKSKMPRGCPGGEMGGSGGIDRYIMLVNAKKVLSGDRQRCDEVVRLV